ncbi:MAG TPA: hypothetical protein DDZ80_32890 [Cyanobacteria bacterium UBA8803]|nr:hypothetical protein [Cyanobacteria bacterium UBA9273]HBL62993.1 hypothetical protein [Cyanobacteria bacterium UBA8803]
MKKFIIISAMTATVLAMGAVYANAQVDSGTSSPSTGTGIALRIDLNRAKNLARQAAERENGGLGRYRAEQSMHGPANESPYVENGSGIWTFTFKGSRPATEMYYVESVVTVDSNTGMVTVDYNGPVRQ